MRVDGPWRVDDTAAVANRIRELRTSTRAFDIAVPGRAALTILPGSTDIGSARTPGATWWVEAVHPWRYGWREGQNWPLTSMRARTTPGPERPVLGSDNTASAVSGPIVARPGT